MTHYRGLVLINTYDCQEIFMAGAYKWEFGSKTLRTEKPASRLKYRRELRSAYI
jgi:hypothetical protein